MDVEHDAGIVPVDEKGARHEAHEPHEYAGHAGPEHAMAGPLGVSTVMHRSIHKRPRMDRRPRDERLVLKCFTGIYNQVLLGLDHDSIPVMPWTAEATFFDWHELAIPRDYSLRTGSVGMFRPTVQEFQTTAAADVSVHHALLPYYEYTATVPNWVASLQMLRQQVDGSVALTTDMELPFAAEKAKRLRVNGEYYQVKLAMQGKLHIPENFTSSQTLGGARPWVRLLAIQFTGPDQSSRGNNQVPLKYFYPHAGSEVLPPEQDPDYSSRRTEDYKSDTYPQPYKILHDQTWQVEKPDGTHISQIPLKLRLAPYMVRRLMEPDRNDGNAHEFRQPYGLDHDGRIIWQLFHNLLPLFHTEENIQYQSSACPFWEGRWHIEIEDGNF